MVILNTPQDFEDLSSRALQDTQFRSTQFGCWTPDTAELPVEYQESSWPERYPSETLRAEKNAAIARNALSIFAREKECRLITPETSAFRAEWIRYFGVGGSEPEPPLEKLWTVLVVDPVPPPSDIQIAKGMSNKDYEAITAVGRYEGKYFVLETIYNRGHEPNWTAATIFDLANRWRPRKIIIESVAYQRTLSWLIRQAMQRAGRYWPVEEFVDKRKKIDRIKQGLAGPLSNGAVYFRKDQTTAVSQVIHYPGKNPEGTHDDVIETIAIGIQSLSHGFVGEVDVDHYQIWDKLSYYRKEQIMHLWNQGDHGFFDIATKYGLRIETVEDFLSELPGFPGLVSPRRPGRQFGWRKVPELRPDVRGV
jgi:predicted phage terminase large subunit-like protein